jgi:hypothetical protein
MDEQLKVFLATIYGEAAQSSPAAWRAIASVILNRVGYREWSRRKSPLEVIQRTGFDAYQHRNAPYVATEKLLADPDAIPATSPLGRLMAAVLPVYGGREPRTTDAVLYWSPRAQARLHKMRPGVWPERPAWRFELLEELKVDGTEGDDFRWYRYI